MSNNKHVPLRASQRKAQMQDNIRKQTRYRTTMFLAFIVIMWLLDITLLDSHLRTTQAAAIGGLLNWFTQTLFTWFVFRFSSVKAKRNIVNQLYLGQLVKWIVTIAGFVIIFSTINVLPTGFILFGFIVMQLVHFIGLWRIR